MAAQRTICLYLFTFYVTLVLAQQTENATELAPEIFYQVTNENSTYQNKTELDPEIEQLYFNETFSNLTPEFNSTFPDIQNITALPETMEDNGGPTAIGSGESAIILSGMFILIACVAYGGMFMWRRYLQIRYSNSDMLITDEVYDISDLRNFEI